MSEKRGGIDLGKLTSPVPSRSAAPVRPRPVRLLWSLRLRVLAAVLAAQAALIGALGYLMVQQQNMLQEQSLINEGYLPFVFIVDQAEDEWERVSKDIERLEQQKTRPQVQAVSPTRYHAQRLVDIVREGREAALEVRSQPLSGPERAVLHKLDWHLDQAEGLAVTWRDKANDYVEVLEAGKAVEGTSQQVDYERDAAALAATIRRLSEFVQDRMRSLRGSMGTRRNQATTVAFGLIGVALSMSVVMLATVSAAVSSVGRLTTQVQRLAEGQHGGLVEVRGEDEVGLLATEFNRMVQTLAVRDATLVRRAEQLNRLSRYLANVLDSLQDGLFVVEHGVVTIANPAAEALWNVVRESPPPDAVRAFLAPGLTEQRVGPRHVEVRVVPFNPSGETGTGLIVLTTDVTERRRALEQLARSERLAQMGQMLAQITHEVRNPLNAMSLNAEMLTDELGELDPERDTEAWALLDTVRGEIERLTQVTAHYLQLARRAPASLEPTDLALLLADVLRLLDAELRQRDVTITTRFAEVEPQLVDGNQLRQAVLNVVRNAVEAGARRLDLRLALVDDEVHIELSDDGPGMDDEEIDRAFDPFFSTKATGTGLGLAITQQILEDHGGEIRADSTKGRGTTVSLCVPARPAPRLDDAFDVRPS